MTVSILCIEDNHFRMCLSAKLLKVMDYKILTAPTGLIGLYLASQKRPNLIIIDIQLPDVNGVSIHKRLKHMACTRQIPTIAIADKVKSNESYLDIGFSACITKATLHLELPNTVQTILKQQNRANIY